MSLGFVKTLGTDAVKVGEKVVHVVEDIGVDSVDAVKVITTAKELTPQLKSGLQLLLKDGEAVATAFVSAGSNPANFAADAAAAASLQNFVKDFVALLPELKVAIADFKADVAPAA